LSRIKRVRTLGAFIMEFELDHLFVCVTEGGDREADRLVGLGLTEGQPNRHPGQGTACRRFFFANAYLELLWVCDPAEAQGETPRPLQLWERWSARSAGACPFGICLRPAGPDVTELPFAAWQYRPSYLPEPLCIHVAAGHSSTEGPLLFYLDFARRPDARPESQRQPLQHRIGLRQITRVLVRGPQALSPVAEEITRQTAGIAFEVWEEHLLEIGFDGERAGQGADLRPLLPVIFRW
jgi:hypothetical protein